MILFTIDCKFVFFAIISVANFCFGSACCVGGVALSSATTSNADDYYCAIGFVNSCLTTNTNTVNVTVLTNPVGLTACQDATAPLSVTKTGTNSVTYQWKKDGVDIVTYQSYNKKERSSL